MKRTIPVRTVPLLTKVHAALRAAGDTDKELKAAADSVLSALVVVIRHEEAHVPADIKPYIDRLPGG